MMIENEDNDDDPFANGEILELFTYDIDIDALWKQPIPVGKDDHLAPDSISESEPFSGSRRGDVGGGGYSKSNLSMRKTPGGKSKRRRDRRMSVNRSSNKSTNTIENVARMVDESGADHTSAALGLHGVSHANVLSDKDKAETFVKPELVRTVYLETQAETTGDLRTY